MPTADAVRAAGPGRRAVTVDVGGVERSALVVVPDAARAGLPLPLVLDLHGSGSTARQELSRSGSAGLAESHGFVVAAPLGGQRVGAGRAWNVPRLPTTPRGPDDETFLLALLEALARAGLVDPGAVCATGISGGARMVSQLACDRPDLFAAIAPVAGLRAGPPAAHGSAPGRGPGAPRGPVPVLAFHGTSDRVNPYAGGGQHYWGYSVPAALARWAEVNGCAPEPRHRTVSRTVRRIAYLAGSRGTSACDAVLYLVDGGGHTWPGSRASWSADEGAVTDEIEAIELIGDFFGARVRHRPADGPR